MLFAIKYILMSIVINVLLGYIFSIINKNICLNLKGLNKMKQEKRNNIICIILTLLALVIFYTCSYINSNFSGVSFAKK